MTGSKVCYGDSQHQCLRFCSHGREAGTRSEDQAKVLPKQWTTEPRAKHRASSLLCPSPSGVPHRQGVSPALFYKGVLSLPCGGATVGTGLERKGRKQQEKNGGAAGLPSAADKHWCVNRSCPAKDRLSKMRCQHRVFAFQPRELVNNLFSKRTEDKVSQPHLNRLMYKSFTLERERNQSSLS